MKKTTLLILSLLLFGVHAFTQDITVEIPTLAAPAIGQTIDVPVILSGASASGIPITANDLNITFNTAVLTYVGLVDFSPLAVQGEWVFGASNGTVAANWLSPTFLPIAFPDGTVLFEIRFTYNGGSSPLSFTKNEFYDGNFILVSTIPIDGAVNGASPAPLAFAMTGGGSYCATGSGVAVGLADSETEVTYMLIKNGSATTTTVPGTGSAISFGLQTAGVYTASGTNAGGTTPMTGSATVTATDPTVPLFAQLGPYCAGATPGLLPTTSTNGITGTWNPATINTATANTTVYTFTPTAGLCATTTTMTVVVNANVTPTFTQLGPYCVGATPGALPGTSNNGITGTWNPATISTVTPGPATYTFTPTAGQCATTASMIIVVNAPVTPTFTQLGPYCVGATPDVLPLISINGINGTWSPAAINTATPNITVYTFTPSAGQCAATTTMTVEVTLSITPTFDQLGPYCVGETPGILPATSNNSINGTWSPATISTVAPGSTTYTFTPAAGQCATTATMVIVVNANVTPTFTQLGPYCVDATPGALPLTSNNGISGTWTPATVSTAAAGSTTYTFTPAAGQCATTATMVIVVNANVTPTFTQLGPYCVGDTPDALPLISINGITGTWNPATVSTAAAGSTTYTFTPDAGPCATSATMVIVVNEIVTPTFNELGPYCTGDTPGLLPATSLNGITGSWIPATINTATSNTTTYTFTPTAGQCATTATMIVIVNSSLTPSVSIVVDENPAVTGNTVTFTATPENEGTAPGYAWFVNSISAGTNSATFSYVPANNDAVYVVLTSSLTCVTQTTATSNTIVMTVNDPADAVWTGSANNGNWYNSDNWSTGVPVAATNVVIPGGLGSNYPETAGVCNNLTIENGASLLVNPVVGGSAFVKSSITADKYHYISSPVTAATAGSVYPASTFMYYYDETDANTQWISIDENHVLAPFKGYSTLIPAATGDQLVTYTGALNSGPFSNNQLTFTGNSTPDYDGYNLVGNPYASRLNLEVGIARTNVDAGVYFWNPSLNGGLGAYAMYTIGTGASTNGATQFASVGQGFFVKVATPGTGTFGVSESSRTNEAQSFYKSTESQISINIAGGVFSDETVILHNEAASGVFDSEYDAYKLKASAVNHVYTKSSDGFELAINALPATEEFNIPLYYEVTESNTYVLTASSFESLGPDTYLWIEDLQTGATQNLSLNPSYEFQANVGDDNERFELTLSPLVGVADLSVNSLKVWFDGQNIRVDNNDSQNGLIIIRNIAGQEIASFTQAKGSSGSYNVACAPGLYLVSVETSNGIVTNKLVIR